MIGRDNKWWRWARKIEEGNSTWWEYSDDEICPWAFPRKPKSKTVVEEIWAAVHDLYRVEIDYEKEIKGLHGALAEAVEFIDQHKDVIGVGKTPRFCLDSIRDLLKGEKIRKIPKL